MINNQRFAFKLTCDTALTQRAPKVPVEIFKDKNTKFAN
jgi:hypothetical protein